MDDLQPDIVALNDRITKLRTLIGRVQWILMWTIFALFHQFLLLAAILILWWLRVDSEAIRATIRLTVQGYGTVASFLGLAGLGAVVYAYVKAWQAIYFSYVRPFLTKDIFTILGP